MAIAMIEQARNLEGARRAIWTIISALVAGNGIWATHYITMIAYASGGRAWYEVGDVVTSAALIFVCAVVACYFLIYRDSLASRLTAGLSLGGGVAAMPFVGILSVAGGSMAGWGETVVLAASASSIALTIGAVVGLQRDRRGRSRLVSLVLLVCAVGLAHFFAWSGGAPSLSEPAIAGGLFGSLAYISKMIGFFGALVFSGIGAGILLDRYQEDRERYAATLEEMIARLQLSEQQAHAANRAKTAFLANMNHEIRTPLNAILGMLEVLHASTLDANQKQQVKIARESAEQLFQILKDVLSLTIIDSGDVTLDDKPFDMKALIDDVAVQLTPKCAAKGLALSACVDAGMPALLRGDGDLVRQVISHLASNAVKFTDTGSISITAAYEGDVGGAERVTVSVKDTGIGIDPAALPALFQEFSQVDNSLARKTGGVGVGLSICAKIARLLKGEIDVESAPAVGSVFRFAFPCVAFDSKPATAAASAPRRSLKILVVDDNHANLYFMSTLLGAEGHACDFATDGYEAIRSASRECYDIILMDVQMPEMDGLTATAKIRGMEREGARVPILAVSAGDEAVDRERCAAAGMDGYVPKPVRPASLNLAIAAALSKAGNCAPAPVADLDAGAASQTDPPAAADAEAIDQTVLTSLVSLFGADDFHAAISSTLDEATDLVAKIRYAVAKEDLASAKKFAHGLKGMAASWGAMKVASAARAIERRLDAAGDTGELTGLVDELDQLIVEARAALDGASSMRGHTQTRAVA
jgi:signal transduction histidine kinase/DNA-binding NarL/FixJ family response regulator